MPPHGANEVAPTTTTSRPPAIRNADAFNRPRRSMSSLSPAGTEVAQGCARALQKRSDTDQVARSLIPRKCLRDLACDPFRGRMRCDVDPNKVSAGQPDDDQAVEQIKSNGWNNEQ